jgi:hypothetical protein
MMIFILSVLVYLYARDVTAHNVYRYEWFVYDDFYVRRINMHMRWEIKPCVCIHRYG